MVAISEIVKNGIVFDPKNWQKAMYNTDSLVQIIENIFDTLNQRNINYLLVGGVALLSYVEGRNTQDIDLILAKSDLRSLPEIAIKEENNDFIRGEYGELIIDILLTQNKLFNKIIQQFATIRQFGDMNIRCVTVEGLVILKFYALPSLYRQGKFEKVSIYENDILLLLLNYSINLNLIFQILSEHLLPSDLEEICNIAADIESRINRFSTQKKKLT
ncbi:MAG: hypothetical protein EWV52_19465 [Microcystis panniformis Mp_MB_F_20051200_S6D]|nr:MAG: hypothetical protein EWV42_24080 [Microcystis panniformis Mp_GB_SS_20050300_S99D]TRV48438.1 MAG: hypothetical protein EWV43_10540 [Microcystis panniformis Mp_MB_F_20080800_S26D]TRV50620.1 MAG: hypothetical protein EWV87_08115 [Microcystis panniformis Mp_GB_SS_20050300_S99]TRV63703.1 MAG: hypothetical protein EWV69_03115 [Microcystis panniformis Mp_MB_F_20080800_S26]TRV64405.1 MAG: hypothetical protein EWV86_10625 [Microcystis panniformis Mp_MB_F_20051200_S9D]TRV69117.1 MAG: hypothetica